MNFLLMVIPFTNMNLMWSFINKNSYLSVYFCVLNLIFLISLWNIFYNVLQFSKNYMKILNTYFNFMMFMFLLSMITLIVCNSWLTLFFGWELLGLTSFFLILYYNNWNSMSGSFLTVMSNRLGDMFFILSLYFFMSFKYSTSMMIMLSMMCFTKSAQFPFSTWLPAAMAAPTPVSSLVHSSTLVTAGIYLYYRFNLMLFNLNKIFVMLFLITTFIGSLSALIETDLKKLVAFSTLSQLGLIFMSFFSSIHGLMFYHLLVHAFFKSILFIISGLMIWSMNSNQNLNKASIFNVMIFSLMLVSILNMMSFTMTSGFLSKEILISMSLSSSMMFNIIMLVILSFTIIYSYRLITSFKMFLNFKMSVNFKMLGIILTYLMFMTLFSYMWFLNWFFSFNFNVLIKSLMAFMMLSMIFKSLIINVFNNLTMFNFFSSYVCFVNLEKDVMNSSFFFMYAFQTKMMNWKIISLAVLFMTII
nr:NADH dehydrogenase subunit 5 [Agamermis sp. BH-2006]